MFTASVFGASDDARALLAKARAAFVQNRERERYWNWTTATTRVIVDRGGRELEKLPSVTVESPIRSDGKRCNAVLAWGDGREPYLATASADARCTVEQEIRELLNEDSLLRAKRVRQKSRNASAITLAIGLDKEAMSSADPFARCTGSVEGKVELDPATFFPKLFDLEISGSGCEQRVAVVNHYDGEPISTAMSTFRKGATVRWEFRLEKGKDGNASHDYWICARRDSVRPLLPQARVLIVWGRRFELVSYGPGRRIAINAATTASELAADTVLRYATDPKEK